MPTGQPVEFNEFQLRDRHDEGSYGIWEKYLYRSRADKKLSLIDLKRLLHIYALESQITCLSYDELHPPINNPLLFMTADGHTFCVNNQGDSLEISGTRELTEEEIAKLKSCYQSSQVEQIKSDLPSLPAVLKQSTDYSTQETSIPDTLKELCGTNDDEERYRFALSHLFANLTISQEVFNTLDEAVQQKFIEKDAGTFGLRAADIGEIVELTLSNDKINPLQVTLPPVMLSALKGVEETSESVSVDVLGEQEAKLEHVYFFLYALNTEIESFREKNANWQLKQLEIKTNTLSQSINGINSYLAKHTFYCHELALVIDEQHLQQEDLFSKLAELIKQLKDKTQSLKVLSITFPQSIPEIDKVGFNQFKEALSEAGLPLEITLKGFEDTQFQKELDDITQNFIYEAREKRISPQEDSQETVQATRNVNPRVKMSQRTRPKRLDLDMEITEELAQTMQVSVDEEAELAKDIAEDKAQSELITLYDIKKFQEAMKDEKSPLYQRLGPIADSLTLQEAKILWHIFMGKMVVLSNRERNTYTPVTKHSRNSSPEPKYLSLKLPDEYIFEKLSEDALVEIIKHKDYFIDGIDLYEWPPGFYITSIKEKVSAENQREARFSDVITLHFSEEIQKKAKRKIHYKQRNQHHSFSIVIKNFQDNLAKIPDGSPNKPSANVILRMCQRYQFPYTYNSEMLQAIAKYSPYLIKLNPEELQEVFSLCDEAKEVAPHLFIEFLAKNHAELASLKSQKVSVYVDSPYIKRLKKLFYTPSQTVIELQLKALQDTEKDLELKKDRDELIEQLEAAKTDEERESLTKQLEEKEAELKKVLEDLLSYNNSKEVSEYEKRIRESRELVEKLFELAGKIQNNQPKEPLILSIIAEVELNERIKAKQLPPDILDKLVEVYQYAGEIGLTRILNTLEQYDIETQAIIMAGFSGSTQSLLDLFDDDYTAFLSNLNSSTLVEKQWLKALITSHRKSNSTLPLATLISSFFEFKSFIDKSGYKLYALGDSAFIHVANMVTTLSQIKNILLHTDIENRQYVWENISQLDFRQGGAEWAMLGTLSRSSFVLPEMNITPEHGAQSRSSSEEMSYRERHGDSPEDLSELSEDKRRQELYRFIAMKPFKYSVKDFYEPIFNMIEAWEGWSDLDKARACVFVAKVTTSLREKKSSINGKDDAVSSQAAFVFWQELLTDSVKNKLIGKKMLEKLLEFVPELPNSTVSKILLVKMGSIGIRNLREIQQIGRLLKEINDIALGSGLGEKIIDGMQCMLEVRKDDDSFSLKNALTDYLALVNDLKNTFPQQHSVDGSNVISLSPLYRKVASSLVIILAPHADSNSQELKKSLETIIHSITDIYIRHKKSAKKEINVNYYILMAFLDILGEGFAQIIAQNPYPTLDVIQDFIAEFSTLVSRRVEESQERVGDFADKFIRAKEENNQPRRKQIETEFKDYANSEFYPQLFNAGLDMLLASFRGNIREEPLLQLQKARTTTKDIEILLNEVFLQGEEEEKDKFREVLNKAVLSKEEKVEAAKLYEKIKSLLSGEDRLVFLDTLEGLIVENGDANSSEDILALLKSIKTRRQIIELISFYKLLKQEQEKTTEEAREKTLLKKANVYLSDIYPITKLAYSSIDPTLRKQVLLSMLSVESSGVLQDEFEIEVNDTEFLKSLEEILSGVSEHMTLAEINILIDKLKELNKEASKLGHIDISIALVKIISQLTYKLKEIDEEKDARLMELNQSAEILYSDITIFLGQTRRKKTSELGGQLEKLRAFQRQAENLGQENLSTYLTSIIDAITQAQTTVQDIVEKNKEIEALHEEVAAFVSKLQEQFTSEADSNGLKVTVSSYRKELQQLIEKAQKLGQKEIKAFLKERVSPKLNEKIEKNRSWTGFFSREQKSYAANFPVVNEIPDCKLATATSHVRDKVNEQLQKTLPQRQELTVLANSRLNVEKKSIDELIRLIDSVHKTSSKYSGLLFHSMRLLESLSYKYPGTEYQVKKLALALCSLSTTDGVEGTAKLKSYYDLLNKMVSTLRLCPDTDCMRALCEHMLPTKAHKGFLDKFIELVLTGNTSFNQLENEEKTNFLRAMTAILNAGHTFSVEAFIKTFEKFSSIGSTELFFEIFNVPPFPSLEKINEMIGDQLDSEQFKDALRQYKRCPAAREKENGFHLKYVLEKSKSRIDQDIINYGDGGPNTLTFDVASIKKLNVATKRFNPITKDNPYTETSQLIEKFKQFKGKPFPLSSEEAANLLAITAELLYRTKARDGGFGNSFEINTTQYLALFKMLTSQSHSMNQIATGEGKTRITMLMAAMMHGLGKTVDLVTSDVVLAIRDYNEYQNFFKMLGAKPAIITSNSSVEDYHTDGGIHFSDAGNISLFRNKALYHGRYKSTVNETKADRCLLLDEADTTMLDAFRLRYNFSAEALKSLAKKEWVYDLIMQYFILKLESTDTTNYETCTRDDFISWYVSEYQESTKEQKEQRKKELQGIGKPFFDAWIESAEKASRLEFAKHYTIQTESELREGPDGVLYKSATLLVNHKPEPSAKFSFGVQQFLHARLNYYKNNPDKAPSDIQKALKALGNYRLFIDMEKQIVVASTSADLLDDYKEAQLIAVTGTSGTTLEQQEIRERFQSADKNMVFNRVPTHKDCLRVHHGFEVTANKESQSAMLVEKIHKALALNQPILIICENDREVRELTESINALDSLESAVGIESITGQMSDEAMAKYVENTAGRPCQITIATGRLGRGTDIKLKQMATEHGLSVLVTHIPESRDARQYEGRAARMGQPGSCEYVLDKSREETRFKAEGIAIGLIEGHFDKQSPAILLPQELRDASYRAERLLRQDAGKYMRQFTTMFYDVLKQSLSTDEEKERADGLWIEFQKQTDTLWKKALKELLVVINGSEAINEYNKGVNEAWDKLQKKWSDDAKLPNDCLINLSETTVFSLADDTQKALESQHQQREQVTQASNARDASTISVSVDLPDGAFEAGKPLPKYEQVILYAEKPTQKRTKLWPYIKAWFKGDISFKELYSRQFDKKRRAHKKTVDGLDVFSGKDIDAKSRKVFDSAVATRDIEYVEKKTKAKFDSRLSAMRGTSSGASGLTALRSTASSTGDVNAATTPDRTSGTDEDSSVETSAKERRLEQRKLEVKFASEKPWGEAEKNELNGKFEAMYKVLIEQIYEYYFKHYQQAPGASLSSQQLWHEQINQMTLIAKKELESVNPYTLQRVIREAGDDPSSEYLLEKLNEKIGNTLSLESLDENYFPEHSALNEGENCALRNIMQLLKDDIKAYCSKYFKDDPHFTAHQVIRHTRNMLKNIDVAEFRKMYKECTVRKRTGPQMFPPPDDSSKLVTGTELAKKLLESLNKANKDAYTASNLELEALFGSRNDDSATYSH